MTEHSVSIRSSGKPTRRRVMAGVAMAVGSLAAGGARAQTQTKMTEEMSSGVEGLLTYLHQEIEIRARRERIYAVLLDAKQFAAFTGEPAEINREVGGAFSLFGARIVGRNVELVPNQRIVQAWRPAAWDPGLYTLVRFELQDQGATTRVVLDHTGFPEGNYRHFSFGWYEHYWDPLRKFLT
ncbi:MAG TPA: SRPBCC domain-containing protein [Terriglobia bacterium]|nr:SRPBCC domain-containing protein [Terriglobia bacterium]